jgi:hypothetical protein
LPKITALSDQGDLPNWSDGSSERRAAPIVLFFWEPELEGTYQRKSPASENSWEHGLVEVVVAELQERVAPVETLSARVAVDVVHVEVEVSDARERHLLIQLVADADLVAQIDLLLVIDAVDRVALAGRRELGAVVNVVARDRERDLLGFLRAEEVGFGGFRGGPGARRLGARLRSLRHRGDRPNRSGCDRDNFQPGSLHFQNLRKSAAKNYDSAGTSAIRVPAPSPQRRSISLRVSAPEPVERLVRCHYAL